MSAIPALGISKDDLDGAEHLVTAAAVVLGGGWAYIKFVRGRVFKARLEPTIEGRLVQAGKCQFAVVKVCIRNVGLSKVQINKKLSNITVSSYIEDNYISKFHSAVLDELGLVRAINLHQWIEPGESVVEEHIFALPVEPLLAIRLQLNVLQERRNAWFPGVEWNAVAIVTPTDASQPPDPGIGPREHGDESEVVKSVACEEEGGAANEQS